MEKWVSLVSSYPGVRGALLEAQRALARQGGLVMVGRDIGTVILPQADLKLFLTASPQVRAQRRCNELRARGKEMDLAEVLAEICRRDGLDSTREDAPLAMAPDAVLIDTDGLGIAKVLAKAYELVEEKRCASTISPTRC